MPRGTKHDGLYKRPKSPYWYFKLKQNGVWREHSTKCKKYNEAKGVKSRTEQDLENGMLPDSNCANSPFSEAVEAYLAAAALRLKLSSLRKERFFLVRPRRQLGSIRCQKVTPLNIRELQLSMKADGCSNSYVNLVVGAASRVLQFAKVWKRLAEDVLRLPESKVPIGRVLTELEKMKLFKTAESNPDWITAYSAGLIAVSTGMRGCELKHLKWGAVDLFSKVLEVNASKTAAGLRRIPLNNTAMHAFKLLHERSDELGVGAVEYYVFPACENGRIDPSKSQKSWRTAWRALTAKAGLTGLRFHDLRHQCITELSESGAADQVILSIAGHVSRRMLEHYSHVRQEAKRAALDGLPSLSFLEPPLAEKAKVN